MPPCKPTERPFDGGAALGDLGLRVMGAGEEMELVNPVVARTRGGAGNHRLDSLTPKQTRSGTCVFVTAMNTFMSVDSTVFNRNRRTVVLRNPVQEA